ncbi:integrase core domain-containing protein [Streptomyces sp. ITFR-6]|uniref:integrase core domain-containing protein n=1 Tax=Streptomyces sp. ITFR-6 TaxID=3075197 RepID=UPI0037DA4355
MRRSMSAVGSADNAFAESFNATFKREILQGRKRRPTGREARLDAFRRLHRYNTRRRLSLFRFGGHHVCGGQAARAVSYAAGLR